MAVVSFTDSTAKQTGKSQRAVRREIQLATNLSEEIKTQITGTPLANKKKELLELCALQSQDQALVVSEIPEAAVPFSTGRLSTWKKFAPMLPPRDE